MNKRSIGTLGEDMAVSYLQNAGYAILDRNYHIRNAEIDIIAEIDGYIVFVEVKMRNSLKHGMPSEAVTLLKQKSIGNAALTYLQKIGKLDYAVRFDVVEILKTNDGFNINHIKNAFDFIM